MVCTSCSQPRLNGLEIKTETKRMTEHGPVRCLRHEMFIPKKQLHFHQPDRFAITMPRTHLDLNRLELPAQTNHPPIVIARESGIERRETAKRIMMPDHVKHAQPSGHGSFAPCWGYGTQNGPNNWGSLRPEFSCCDTGGEQSPIDLINWRNSELAPVEYDYGPARLSVENTGRTIQFNLESKHGIVLDGVHHELRQFHFHHGSEHLVEGSRLPLELHLVHEGKDGSLAVVGVLFREGPEHVALEPIWKDFPGQRRVVAGNFDLSSLLPRSHLSWRYPGSLTTPPCTEGVAWIILGEPLSMSAGQIARFASIFPNNFRSTQPLGDRILQFG